MDAASTRAMASRYQAPNSGANPEVLVLARQVAESGGGVRAARILSDATRDHHRVPQMLLDDTLPSLTISELMLDDTLPSLTIG